MSIFKRFGVPVLCAAFGALMAAWLRDPVKAILIVVPVILLLTAAHRAWEKKCGEKID